MGEAPIKKKKKKSKEKEKDKEMENALRAIADESQGGEGSGETNDIQSRGKTPLEIAYLKRKRDKEMELIKKKANLNHKEKVEKFNSYLNKLTEHYDIPKVSWTK